MSGAHDQTGRAENFIVQCGLGNELPGGDFSQKGARRFSATVFMQQCRDAGLDHVSHARIKSDAHGGGQHGVRLLCSQGAL